MKGEISACILSTQKFILPGSQIYIVKVSYLKKRNITPTHGNSKTQTLVFHPSLKAKSQNILNGDIN